MKNDHLYEVDLSSIWANERQLFLDGKSSLKFASEFWDEIQVFIVQHSKPDIPFEDLDSEYYQRTFNIFSLATSDLNHLFQIEYFYNNKGYYNCNTNLVIDNSHQNFHYWFSLKLRQFENNIFEIPKFLNYHLKITFNRNSKNFDIFLDSVLQQYQQNLLDPKVVKTIEKWKVSIIIDSNSFMGNESVVRDRKYLHQIYSSLKEQAFISKKTMFLDFENIFSGNKVKNKIIWCGSNVELQYLVKNLYSKKFVSGPKDKWITTVSCFINSNEDAFTTDQLRNANGLKDERKIIIDSIFKHSAVNKN